EVGRGPLPDTLGRFNAIRQVSNGIVLEYTVSGAMVQERMQESHTNDAWTFAREFHVAPSQRGMWLLLGTTGPTISVAAEGAGVSVQQSSLTQREGSVSVWTVRIPAHGQPLHFVAKFTYGVGATVIPSPMPLDPGRRRWPQEVATTITPSTSKDAFVVDDIGLPVNNPWHRSV